MRKQYTQEQKDYILSHPKESVSDLSKRFNRTKDSVKAQIYRMRKKGLKVDNIKKCIRFTDEEVKFIIDNPNLSNREVANRLNKTRVQIYDKRKRLDPNFKEKRKPKQIEPDGFTKLKRFLESNGFKNTHEAIAHYGGVRQFKEKLKL